MSSDTFPTLDQVICSHIMAALQVAGNQRKAARLLGITRWALMRKLRRYGIGVNGHLATR